jgi:SET domain-containing protein
MARFINHGNDGQANLYSENKMSNGEHVIVFFAKRDINIGEELFFDYDGAGDLFANHKTKYPFIKKKKGR